MDDSAADSISISRQSSKISEHDNRNWVKRPQTATPYVMAVKYRNKSKIPTRKSNRIVINRKRSRRRITSTGGESFYGEESLHTTTSYTDFFDEFNDDYDYDGSDTDDLASPLPKPATNDTINEEEESFISTSLGPTPVPSVLDRILSPSKQDEDGSGLNGQSSYCVRQYKRMCKHLNIIPVSSFIRELSTKQVLVKHRSLCYNGAKAIAVALLENGTVQKLDISDNEIGPAGAAYLAEMLNDNRIITHLNLSDNQLGVEGIKHIVEVAVEVDNFESLNLSGNGLREFDAIHLQRLFEDTQNLQRLVLSHNEFREFGGKVIGDALKINDTIEHLDLSWNHLRFAGADAIAEGVSMNQGLKSLDISWNGFSIRGCQSLATALSLNDTLVELNLECNRINKDALEKLLKGMKNNASLQKLKIGWNPITTKGAQMILDFINDTPNTGLKHVDIKTQLVEKAFSEDVKKLKEDRNISIIHGLVRGSHGTGDDEDELSLIDENPVIVLMEFGHMNGFRLLDLFSVFDKDGSKSLDLTEIKTGLMDLIRMAGIPLQEKPLNLLIDKLDEDGSGEIEYVEMLQAQMIHRKEKAKMMKAYNEDDQADLEQTDVGRVRGKLHRLMAKRMDKNPAFKRRVEEFKKMLASSKKQEAMKAETEKKLLMRKQSKERLTELKKAKEEALHEIIEADMIETQMSSDVKADDKNKMSSAKNTPRTEQNEKEWKALHV